MRPYQRLRRTFTFRTGGLWGRWRSESSEQYARHAPHVPPASLTTDPESEWGPRRCRASNERPGDGLTTSSPPPLPAPTPSQRRAHRAQGGPCTAATHTSLGPYRPSQTTGSSRPGFALFSCP